MPPRIKVYEALGAVADGRVSADISATYARAKVVSSDGTRSYRVIVSRRRERSFDVYSDDNGTRLRGYVGYPIISVLMLMRVLPFKNELAVLMKGIPWRVLNEKFKKYSIVEEYILRDLELDKRDELVRFVDLVLGQLRQYRFYYDENLVRKSTLTDWLPKDA